MQLLKMISMARGPASRWGLLLESPPQRGLLKYETQWETKAHPFPPVLPRKRQLLSPASNFKEAPSNKWQWALEQVT